MDNLQVFDESLYEIKDIPNGFRIFRKDYLDAEIKIHEQFFFSITIDRKEHYRNNKFCCFIEYRKLRDILAEEVFDNWCIKNAEKIFASKYKRVNKNLKAWLIKKFSNGINYAIFPKWKELTKQINPDIFSVFNKFMSTRGPKAFFPPIFFNEKLYENKQIVKDLKTYNSIHFCIDNAVIDNNNNIIFENQFVNNWRLCFSNCKKTYKALNKTLDNFPRSIRLNLVKNLRYIHITEPINDRVKMLAILNAFSYINDSWGKDNRVCISHFACIMRSSPAQIRKAFKIYKKNYEQIHNIKFPYSLRKNIALTFLINYIFDYPDTHEGEIVGLLEKSHRWHQERERQREAERAIAELRRLENNKAEAEMRKKPTALPPIPLPEIEGVKFLSTVQEVFDEGANMKHCISSYAERARKGQCYLFHVEKNKLQASIMLDSSGKIVQSYGPRNCINEASKWASASLSAWGRKLSKFVKENKSKCSENKEPEINIAAGGW